MTLDIPAGDTLKDSGGAPLRAIFASVPPTPPTPPPDNAVILDYFLGPDGASFNPPLDLTLQYDPSAIPARGTEDTLYLASWDGAKWVAQESQLDITKNTISAKITHFSQYAILDKIPPPAKFDLSGLQIPRTETRYGELVSISVWVNNSGGSRGSYTVTLKINGTEADKQSVTLAAGTSQQVNFEVNKTEPGTYLFEVNGLPGRFQVLEGSPSPSAETSPSAAITPSPAPGAAAEIKPETPEALTSIPVISAASTPEKVTIPVQKSFALPVKWIIIGLAVVMIMILVVFAARIKKRA
jgi:hypothetical protein